MLSLSKAKANKSCHAIDRHCFVCILAPSVDFGASTTSNIITVDSSLTTDPSSATSAMSSPPSDPDKAFIQEHGRLYRPVEHYAFDPFRRPVLKVPVWVSVAQRLLSLILIPFRLSVAVLVTFFSYILVVIFGPPIDKGILANFSAVLLPPWRRAICKFATKLLARALLLSLGFWTVEGRDAAGYDQAAAEKATIVSNHSSLADPCLLAYLHAPAFVAKSIVSLIPGVGRVGAAQHAFYIDRMNGSGVSVTDKMVERQKLVREAKVPVPPVCIFPEGTTTNGLHLLKFRTGAFVAGTPVAPVLIRYKYEWFSPSYETVRTPLYLYGILSQFANRVEYFRLPVYYPSAVEMEDPSLYARNVQKLMLEKSEEAFGTKWTPSDSNYVDKIEYHSLIRGTVLRKDLQLNKDR